MVKPLTAKPVITDQRQTNTYGTHTVCIVSLSPLTESLAFMPPSCPIPCRDSSLQLTSTTVRHGCLILAMDLLRVRQEGRVLDQEQVHRHVLAAALDWLAEMDILNGRTEDTELLVQVGVEGFTTRARC